MSDKASLAGGKDNVIPIRCDDTGHCRPDCPYMEPFAHPYYHHNAWCWKVVSDLEWYDYWLAECIEIEKESED